MGEGLVYLVGRRLPHNENLGLGYLSAALARAELASRTRWLNTGGDIEPIAREIARTAPDVVGLALPDGGSAFLPLALGEMLRRLGYRGHVTAGGPFATLAREWLLARYEWLDSVVRFAGEVPLVQIAEHVSAGQGVDGIAGVTTRAGDGRAAPVLDDTPMRLTPTRGELPEILGARAAHVCASRGCEGRCHYCGPAALHTLERAEGRRGGATLGELDACGVGTVRRRDVERLADEMASLYHERDVRYFYLVDEHVLPYDEPGALAFLRLWREALAERRVGPIGIGCMLRADRLTPAIVDELAETGVIRTFVGLELASQDEGRRFGRPAPSERDLELLARFSRRGIATVSNVMLVHPYSTPRSIEGALAFLERIEHGVIEATRMQVYHGTKLHQRMLAEGRLVGNPLRWGYVFESPEMERFAEIFARLRGEAFHDYSVACRTHDAHLALALARSLWGARVPRAATEPLERARASINVVYCDAYRQALGLALDGGGFGDANELVRAMRSRAEAIELELDRVEEVLSDGPVRLARWFAPMRAAATGVLTFTLAASPIACGGASHTPGADGSGIDAGRADSGAMDAGTGRPDSGVCTAADTIAATDTLVARARAADPCFNGYVSIDPPGAGFYVSAPVAGTIVQLSPCRTDPTAALLAAAQARVQTAVATDVPRCAPATVSVDGGAQADIMRMGDALASCADALSSGIGGGPIVVVLGPGGAVTDVRTTPPGAPVADCIRTALAGLEFPCLASFEVCPEYVIVE